MADLSAFPITRRWPAAHPDRLQLYSLPTPNGVKVSIMLEETGLPYEPHLVDFGKDDQKTPEFLSLNPERQDPGDHRSRRARRQAARPVRIGRDPALPRRQDRPAACRPIRRGAGRRSSGCSSRWRRSGRCSARSASSTSSPARRFEDKRPLRALRRRVEAPARRAGDAARRARLDHGRRLHDRRHLDARLGAQPDRLSTRRASWSGSTRSSTSPAWLERGLARPAVQRGLDIPKRS